jgi:predicted esterase
LNKENRLGFVHKFIPSKEKQGQGGREKVLTFLLLHGTGGNEEDLIPIGREISSEAAILSPRGKVLENGMPRFFRRLTEGIFDIEDLKFRTKELADFVKDALQAYGFEIRRVIAVGYSNGANIDPVCFYFIRKSFQLLFFFVLGFHLYRKYYQILSINRFSCLLEYTIQ